ncbi:MAG: hypothetical protein ABT25_30240 [Variovorax sp. SCN 67-20]|uniref:hypothetical protein n=1 Tax=Variovorax sp. SCN 67-20 TaxID=1660153 RepID=UPI0008689E63
MTSTLHALDHAARLVEILSEPGFPGGVSGAFHDIRAVELYEQAMRATRAVGESITAESALTERAESISWTVSAEGGSSLAEIERAAKEVDAMQRGHRVATLAAVAPGKLTAAEAFARIDAARRFDRIVHHAWRASAHLLGRGEHAVDAIDQKT